MAYFNSPLRAPIALALAAVTAPLAAQNNPVEDARLFPARVLAAHNAARSAVGVAPLQWDDRLGTAAAKYAVQLAISRRFAHSTPEARGGAGENLWMGTRHAFTVSSMVDSWVSEKRLYVPGVFPAVSRNGDWEQVGHYTQIVWPGTQRVGCALATNSGEDYLVCQYWPAGNVRGLPLRVRPQYASLSTRN